MNCHLETFCEKNRTLELVGSQINLTPRSDQSVSGTYSFKNCKFSSPTASSRTQIRQKLKHLRPKSAECCSEHFNKCDSTFLMPLDICRNYKSDNSSITVSNFTNSSSKLLQHLIGTPSRKVSVNDGSNFLSDSSSVPFKNFETEEPETSLRPESKIEFSKTDYSRNYGHVKHNKMDEQLSRSWHELNLRESPLENIGEKSVRFSDGPYTLKQMGDNKFGHYHQCPHSRHRDIIYTRSKSELLLPRERPCQRKRKISDPEKLIELDTRKAVDISHCDISTNPPLVNENEVKKNCEEINCQNFAIPEKVQNNSEDQGTAEDSVHILEKSLLELEDVSQPNSKSDEAPNEDKRLEETGTLSSSSEGIIKESLKSDEIDENSNSNQKINFSDSTYEEIVQLLQTIEDENSESLLTANMENKEESSGEFPKDEKTFLDGKIDYFGVVSSYLEELELHDSDSHKQYTKDEKWDFEGFSSPRLEELLNKNSVELAHEVLSLKIQVEDQKKGIKLLKDTLAEMKQEKKTVELDHQEELRKINSEAEALVQRHQKFIKRLLSEKNNLNQTVSKLVQDLKSGEEKHKRNIKAIEEKHEIELKRAKEAQALADKIKREKWMEVKTQKIKEMTVKGLEPELSRMAVRQQEEMTELRNLHKAEIEAIELRAARRSADLMDELRVELAKEKERVVAQETAALRATMENKFEEERNELNQSCQLLKDKVRRMEEKLSNQEEEFEQRLIDFKQEEEKKRQKNMREHEDNVKEIQRQHLVDLRNLRESLQAEKEVFLNNYKKEQAAKFFEREAELHQQYKKERDKEIEMIIETLENEASQIQSELTVAGEAKLKRLRQKMEAEMKEIEESEAACKAKLLETKSKLLEKEDFITELNSQIRQLQTELGFFKKSCEEMSSEKAKIKEIIREEFESSITALVKEKENLQKEMVICKELHAKELAKRDNLNIKAKHEMQKELTRVYSRIKVAVNKKEKVIESLQQENGAINLKCRQLELMLDKQRRNLLL